MKKSTLFFSVIFCGYLHAYSLILIGVDTIQTNKEFGFDFITQQACTTFSYETKYNCYNHFDFFYYTFTKQFSFNSERGYGYQAGKTNLDSLKSAPHDTIFNKLSLHIDSLPQDSLREFIGNCYIIKTGNDPRPAIGGVYYAKIKILNFKVIDSAQHKVEMAFLWAFQFSNGRDLGTSGLDTFNLSTPVLSSRNSALSPRNSPNVFKVLGDRFTVPSHLLGSKASLGVYDLRGKLLGKVVIGDRKVIDLSGFVKGRGVVVVRGE